MMAGMNDLDLIRDAQRKRAVEALFELYQALERLDSQAQEPGPDGMVRVTVQTWRDLITPNLKMVREALSESKP